MKVCYDSMYQKFIFKLLYFIFANALVMFGFMGFVRKKRLFLMMLLPLRIIMNLRNIRNQTLTKKLITNIIGRITNKHLSETSLNFRFQLLWNDQSAFDIVSSSNHETLPTSKKLQKQQVSQRWFLQIKCHIFLDYFSNPKYHKHILLLYCWIH